MTSGVTLNVYSDVTNGIEIGVKVIFADYLVEQAAVLFNGGRYLEAERLHRQALNIKLANVGPDALQTAFSWNILGEVQLRQGKLDDAETSLREAIRIREAANEQGFDAAVSRDNLARVYEAKGMLLEARNMRAKFPRQMTCSNYHCPGDLFTRQDLRQCSQCVSVYYCSEACQRQDWKKRHKHYCIAYHRQAEAEEGPSEAQ